MVDLRHPDQAARTLRSRFSPSDFEAVLAERAALLAEMLAIGRVLEATRQNMAALGVGDIHHHVPKATEELDAIVLGSAEAADTILDTCEQLDSAAAEMPEACKAPIHEATKRIFEACSFQDITGQRAAKVERVLKLIDRKVAHIVIALGAFPAMSIGVAKISQLDGPRRGPEAMDQHAVDTLLASFE